MWLCEILNAGEMVKCVFDSQLILNTELQEALAIRISRA